LPEKSAKLGEFILAELSKLQNPKYLITARGLGLMAGLEIKTPNGSPASDPVLRAIKSMLHRGYILLPEGEHGNVISFTPPLTITKAQLAETVSTLSEVLNETL